MDAAAGRRARRGRPRHLAERAPLPPGEPDRGRGQARGVREAAGHDLGRVRGAGAPRPRGRGRQRRQLQHPLLPAEPARCAQLVGDGELGEVRLVTGHYFQDWLLLDTDWNWRLDPAEGGMLRAVGDIGSPLARPHELRGRQPDRERHGRPRDVRQGPPPARPARRDLLDRARRRTRSPARWSPTTRRRSCSASRAAAAARCPISQVSAGRKNSLQCEIDGSAAAAAWDSERPDELWIGHRERPNELLHPQPRPDERRRHGRGEPAGRPRRGVRRHLQGALPGGLRRRRRGRPGRAPRLPHVRRRPRRDARQRRDRRERPRRALGRGRRG